MSDTQAKAYRERLRERRREERTLGVMQRLYRALQTTMTDAEQRGAVYDGRSPCRKALDEYTRWEQERQASSPM